jgi:hypothetical protein
MAYRQARPIQQHNMTQPQREGKRMRYRYQQQRRRVMAAILAVTGVMLACGSPIPFPTLPPTQAILYTTDHTLTSPPQGKTWAADTCQGQRFLANDPPAWEWTPVLDPTNPYETAKTLVGVSGTAVLPQLSGDDLPFTHPYGYDWEVFVAPDAPYANLLAPSNQAGAPNMADDYKQALQHATANPTQGGLGLGTPGLLGMETDQGLLPSNLRAQDGDRIVAFGRWIADCGHEDFHTEIHPPLLIASGHAVTPIKTTIQISSRPYLVSQDFGDGALREHLLKELAKLVAPIPLSLQVEAHPTLLPPFQGIQLMTFYVRPQTPRQSPSDRLLASYHFTLRKGVAVQVFSTGHDEVGVTVLMNDVNYVTPTPTGRTDLNVTPADLGTEGKQAMQVLLAAAAIVNPPTVLCPVIAACLSVSINGAGIKTDSYPALSASSPLDTQNAVTDADVDHLPSSSAGFAVDPNQALPIYGSLTVQWAQSGAFVHIASPANGFTVYPPDNANHASVALVGSGSPGMQYTWSDSLDGNLGSGQSITASLSLSQVGNCQPATTHVVTLTGKDAQGHTATASITVYVNNYCVR